MSKICKTCKAEKSLEEFAPHTIYPDGRHYRCLKCQEIKKEERKLKKREYSNKVNPEKNKKYKENGYFKRRYSEKRQEIRAKEKEYASKNKHKTHERYLKRSEGKVKFRMGFNGPFSHRICNYCKQNKHLTEYNKSNYKCSFGFSYTCKECRKIKRKIYHNKNKEKGRKYCKNYRENNPEAFQKSQIKHRKTEKYKITRQKRRSKLHNRILEACRTRINIAVREYKMNKTKHTIEYLGCDIEFFVKYLESKFLEGMSWDNYGWGMDKWNIDHIKPARAFDLANSEKDRQECFHYLNMQPLWQLDNFTKNDILPDGERARNIVFA